MDQSVSAATDGDRARGLPSAMTCRPAPQAFTHLGLISAAYDLNRRLDAAGWSA
jgi:hypothetical protein